MAGRKIPAAFWVCFLILLVPVLCVCIYQIFDRVSFYMSYPVTQESKDVIQVQSQAFPSVTVCNNNPVRKSAVSGTSYASLLNTDGQVRQSVENLLASTSSDAVNPSAAREILNTAYQDRRTARATGDLAGMSREDIANLGHQLSDFVMSCSYNGQQCVPTDLSSVFATFQSAKFGNCFTFNAGFQVSSKGQGLTMTLFADAGEYYEQDATWRDNCDCKHPCKEESYVTTMTSSTWAPENVLIPELNYVTPLPDVGSLIKQNVVQVKVSYLDGGYQQVEERPAYPVNQLFRDIGITIAIWFMVLLILIGIVYLIVLIIRACCGEGSGNKLI
uniref:Uncharacterized protein n=1 Tax=Branchiostoma floridae TaxID=7739 RepID=C3Y361_BRAFL|eukprot:XP_002609463.1 hypothetical protein BRAFLDRAFT_127015 [Branchiostoma floridae]